MCGDYFARNWLLVMYALLQNYSGYETIWRSPQICLQLNNFVQCGLNRYDCHILWLQQRDYIITLKLINNIFVLECSRVF